MDKKENGLTKTKRRFIERPSWIPEPFFVGSLAVRITAKETDPLSPVGLMQTNATHPISENELYLRLFITNGGGW
jgi:hypothetical protein